MRHVRTREASGSRHRAWTTRPATTLPRRARRCRAPAERSGRQMPPEMSPRCHRSRSSRIGPGVAPVTDRVDRRPDPSEGPAPQLGRTPVAASRMAGVRPGRRCSLERPVARRSVDGFGKRQVSETSGCAPRTSLRARVGQHGGGLAAGGTAETTVDVGPVPGTGDARERLRKGEADVSSGAGRSATRADRRRRLGRGSHTCILDPGRTRPPRTRRGGTAHDAVVWPNPTPSGAGRLPSRNASPVSRLAPGALLDCPARRTRQSELRRSLAAVWWPRALRVVGPHVAWPRLVRR